MVGPTVVMLQFATTFPVTVKELLAVAASASGARAASTSSVARLEAQVQHCKILRRLRREWDFPEAQPLGVDRPAPAAGEAAVPMRATISPPTASGCRSSQNTRACSRLAGVAYT